ncbi:SusC/RagA family TonB-linked outer membrane protein [Pedobacter immunditicola]|uniref:SusC/RagA family TonB-linked outer membrane protein n=1 Tax=Pedobacter immunditicola TaxID=3133440 RepID=UPI0030ACFDA3
MQLNAFPKAIHLAWPNQKKLIIILFIIFQVIFGLLQAPAASLKSFTNAQKIIIQGKVVDQGGLPLPGASVKVKGSTESTITNSDGKFTINAPNEASVLVVSYIGYQVTEAKVTTGQSMVITLNSANAQLDELVVVGYGVQKKVNLTGAIASVDSKTLESRPLTNLGQGLQGLVPNLNITVGSGKPGSGAGFNIRGITSINGGSPLVLVDGVQMDPNLINPNDVENVTVLKDASAAAIYGVRAAFGVVLITTKKGKKNSPMQVNYAYDYTLTRPTKLPKTMNSVDYINSFLEANKTGSISGGETAANPFTDLDLQKAQAYLSNPTPENAVYVDPGNPRMYRYVGNTDWAEMLYPGSVPQQQHNISLSGGDAKTTYIGSFGYFNQKGLLKAAEQDYNRYNANMRVNTEINSWLSLNFRMLLNRVDDDSPASTDIGSLERLSQDLRPMMPVKHPNGNYSGQGNFTNPFAVLENNGRSITKSNDLWLTGGWEINPLKNVKVIGDYTWNSYASNITANNKSFYEYGANGTLLGLYPWTATPRVFESNTNDRYVALNTYAQYENTFFNKHYLKAMVGYNQEVKEVKAFNANVKNLINQDIPAINLNSDAKPNVGGVIDDWAVSGTFFRLNYAFDNKYLIEANGRYDGTSRFARGQRYSFQPSVSAGWRISQEGFFQPLKTMINEFKIRGSYGSLGNQQLASSYPYIANMNSAIGGYIFGNQQQTAVFAPGLVSAYFTWEKVDSRNIGVDFALLNNRLSGSFDYYIRDTKDMVVAGSPVPSVLGAAVPNQNAADLRTKGFELSMGWQDKIGENWSYNIVLALSDNKATITKYNNPNGLLNNYYVGQNFGEIWGFETDGFYQTDEEAALVDNSAIWGGTWLAGDVKYKDLNGDGKITRGNQTLEDSGDLKVIGNSTPRYQYSINASVQFKGFDFTAFLQGVGDRNAALGGNYFWGYTNQWSVPTEAHVGNYWTPETPDAYFPRARFGGGGNFQTQSKFLQDASYLRVKQLTLGFAVPQNLLSRVKINRLRVYVTGQNLFEFTKMHENFDPEQFDRFAYPINKSVSFGVQLGL